MRVTGELKQSIQPLHKKGFTLVEIIIVVALIGLLAAIVVPNYMRSRTSAQTNICISNLRTIDHAIQQWALEMKKAANAPVQFSDISSYLKNSVTCPAGGATFADSYSISVVGAEPNCQRFPGAHLIPGSYIGEVASTPDPSSASPSSQGSPAHGSPAHGNGNGNNGNGNNGNGNGNNDNGNGP